MSARLRRGARALQALCGRRSQPPQPEPLGPDSPEAQRLRKALEMREFGIAIYRQRMRREHPEATEEEIDAMVWAWMTRQDDDEGIQRQHTKLPYVTRAQGRRWKNRR